LRVLFLHDVAIADAFRRRLDRKGSLPVAPFDPILWRLVCLSVLERADILDRDLNFFQFESLRQVRGNETGDLQLFQVLQRRCLRASKRKRKNNRAQTTEDSGTE